MQKIIHKSLIFVVSFLAVLSIWLLVYLIITNVSTSEVEPVFAVSEDEEELPRENEEPLEPAPAPTPEPTPEPTPIPTARLAFVGDVMCHLEQLNAARVSDGVYEFDYKFRYIAPYIRSADFAIANLETTFSRGGYAGWPLFRSPASLGQALINAGFDMVTTGNNHSFDGGVAGVHTTIEILNELGLPYTGTYLTPECREIIDVFEVNGFTFAVLNFTMHTNAIDFGENNFMVKIIYHDLVGQSRIDYEMIAESMARARALETDFIVVLPHIGIEYYGTMNRNDTFNRSDSRWVNWVRTLELFLDEGADIVMNHHPHTLLPAEFVYITEEDGSERRAFMAYSMANFVSAQRTQPRETSAVFYVDVTRDEDGNPFIAAASYTPVWVRQNDPTIAPRLDFTILPVTETLQRVEEGETPDLRAEDVQRIRQVHLDVTHMLSGEPIPLEEMEHEYPITRQRARDEFPGLPLWGTLPWR